MESKAQCRYLKKLTCKGTLRQVFYLCEPPPLLWPRTPRPHPLHTVYVYKEIVQLFTKPVENTDMTDCTYLQSITSINTSKRRFGFGVFIVI